MDRRLSWSLSISISTSMASCDLTSECHASSNTWGKEGVVNDLQGFVRSILEGLEHITDCLHYNALDNEKRGGESSSWMQTEQMQGSRDSQAG